VSDTGSAKINDAEEIGLFRSEFFYLEADHYPTANSNKKGHMLRTNGALSPV